MGYVATIGGPCDMGHGLMQGQIKHEGETPGDGWTKGVHQWCMKESKKVAYIALLAPGIYKYEGYSRRVPFSIRSPHVASPRVHQLHLNIYLSSIKMTFNNNSYNNNEDLTGANPGYPFVEGNNFDSCPLPAEQFPGSDSYNPPDSDPPIAGPSRSQDWYLDPLPEVYASQSGYQKYPTSDAPMGHFADPCAYGAKFSDTGEFDYS